MDDLLSVAYMPVVESEGNNILYWEALARMRQASEGCSQHVQFIAAGEEFGFIHMIDIAMIRKVATQLRLQPDLVLGLNISVLTLERHLALFMSEFDKYMDVANRMVFELTETVQIADINMLRNFIYRARLANARVALDDVDSGYFKVKHIYELEPDFVKLSGRIVNLIFAGKANMRRFDHLLLAAMGCGGKLVAENIDTKEKRAVVTNLGVPFVQGYLFGRPVSETARLKQVLKMTIDDQPRESQPLR